ncbi:hypothetical protein SLEP1_g13786 [Rubroshorea leprosula]|uniref:Uncharacterized protein n=1 Tax=Rubroshorea leprosula TaxID=152421 RepID=A0AAV5IRH3_9ROSI|nr:hypothetical protein SLEP1_g13786 [Rubroshorea leprosula]
MSSRSTSSSSSSGDDTADRNSNPTPIEQHFESLSLAEPVVLASNHQETENEITNGTLNQETNDDDSRQIVSREGDAEEVAGSVEQGGVDSGGVVWERENSEVEMEEGLPSPSSSGYAGERGSSSATSASRMDEMSDVSGEIQEVRNDGSLGGVSDFQGSWIPGKRHVDELWKCSWGLECGIVMT